VNFCKETSTEKDVIIKTLPITMTLNRLKDLGKRLFGLGNKQLEFSYLIKEVNCNKIKIIYIYVLLFLYILIFSSFALNYMGSATFVLHLHRALPPPTHLFILTIFMPSSILSIYLLFSLPLHLFYINFHSYSHSLSHFSS